ATCRPPIRAGARGGRSATTRSAGTLTLRQNLRVIGVIANPSDERIVREFFELFKTPWEFFRDSGQYDVVLCAGGPRPERVAAKLLVVYSGDQTPGDRIVHVA